MKRDEFTSKLRQQTAGIHVSEQLRQRTIDAVYAKEAQKMKRMTGRNMAVIALAVVMSIVMCGAAFAAVQRAGILDFFRDQPEGYVPEDAQSYIQTENILLENELIEVTLQEIYYDGLQSQMTVHVTPKDEKVMLLGGATLPDEPWVSQNLFNPSSDNTDRRTVWEVYQQEGYTAAYRIRIRIEAVSEDTPYEGYDKYTVNEDGSLSILHREDYPSDEQQRDVKLVVQIIPMFAGDEQLRVTQDQVMQLTHPLTLDSAAVQKEVYVSREAAQFPSVGVQVDQLRVEVKPYELYVSVYYSVTDEEAFNRVLYEDGEAFGEINEFIGFELIDPESTASQPWDQRLSQGVSGQGGEKQLSAEGEEPQRFMYHFDIGRNELHEEYTLRVFEWASKERFESVTMQMRPAEVNDLETYAD